MSPNALLSDPDNEVYNKARVRNTAKPAPWPEAINL